MRITPEIFEIFMGRPYDPTDLDTILYCQSDGDGSAHSVCGWCITHMKTMYDCNCHDRSGCKKVKVTP